MRANRAWEWLRFSSVDILPLQKKSAWPQARAEVPPNVMSSPATTRTVTNFSGFPVVLATHSDSFSRNPFGMLSLGTFVCKINVGMFSGCFILNILVYFAVLFDLH